MYDPNDLLLDLHSHYLMNVPPPPQGGRAALGTAAGLGMATIAAAAWSKLARGVWNPHALDTRRDRRAVSAALVVGALVGSVVGARSGHRASAAVGAFAGGLLGQLPTLIDPALVRNHPIAANFLQYGLPIAGAVFASNLEAR